MLKLLNVRVKVIRVSVLFFFVVFLYNKVEFTVWGFGFEVEEYGL